jgi:hypothetical protein
MPRPLIGVMLCKVVSTNYLIRGILDACHKLVLTLSIPDSGGNLWHRNQNFQQGGFFHLHMKATLLAKGPQAASKEFFHHITTTDKRGYLNESCEVSVVRAIRRGNLRLIV